MKKVLLITLSLFMLKCSQQQVKSEREKSIDITKEIVMKFYTAQVGGDIETMKSMVSEDFEYTLNGQLDITTSPNKGTQIKIEIPLNLINSFQFIVFKYYS